MKIFLRNLNEGGDNEGIFRYPVDILDDLARKLFTLDDRCCPFLAEERK